MDAAKKVRTVVRAAFTRKLNYLNEEFGAEAISTADILVSLQVLEEKARDLNDANKRLFECMIQENCTEKDIEQESEGNDDYTARFYAARNKAVAIIEFRPEERQPQGAAQANGNSANKRKIQLPTIELKKFNGEIKEWLSFWSQFKKIDEDGSIDDEDKFQYLIQTMVPGSRAAELVLSFPPTKENYVKVIESLKNRFGNDELLVEVYVRELLKLVMKNAVKSDERVQLASLYDKIESQLRALESLGVTTDKCGAMLYPLVESSLPEDLLRAWQRRPPTTSVRTDGKREDRLSQLIKFLQNEVDNEERIALAVRGFDFNSEEKKPVRTKSRVEFARDNPSAMSLHDNAQVRKKAVCVFCDGEHWSAQCEKARKMTLDDRKQVLQNKHACFNCTKVGHLSKACRGNQKCAWCGKRHVVLMCSEKSSDRDSSTKNEVKKPDPVKELTLLNNSRGPEVLLQTLRATMRGDTGERVVRVFLDSGSTRSYAIKPVLSEMKYQAIGEHCVTHSLFGNVTSSPKSHKRYCIRLASLDRSFACNFKVYDEDEICARIPLQRNQPWLCELKELGIEITDTYNAAQSTEPIAVLIGTDVLGKIMTGRVKQLACGLTAVETKLGWTLMGETSAENDSVAKVVTSMFQREAAITDLWNLDVIGIGDPATKKSRQEHEREVHEKFIETTTINDEGRYEVELPWTEAHSELPSNLSLARQRLETTTRKLITAGLYDDYDAVLQEWLADGVIEAVPEEEVDKGRHYLPHRGVLKEGSTTRLRPVFDASAKGKDSPSLNQCLETGPNLIELISSILLRFRKEKIGIIADIKKAFLQISIRQSDRNYLRFLWYNQNREVAEFRHNRVVFGVSSSPYLLGAVIEMHLQRLSEDINNVSEFKDISFSIQKLRESLYVDNCVASVDCEAKMATFIHDARIAMLGGAFDLRGWEFSGQVTGEKDTPVLGLIWNKDSDTLRLALPALNTTVAEKVSKRLILSVAHRVFDPIGFSCPITLIPKLLIQKTWKQKIKWDDEVDEDSVGKFLQWSKELLRLPEIQIPRWVFSSADLLAATMGARLTQSTLESLRITQADVTYWSDSSTVIFWIQRCGQWGNFVNNRVKEIRSLSSPRSWKHIDGESNPADLPSRGCSVDTLIAKRWWDGPKWLKLNSAEWPISKFEYKEDEINTEIKRSVRNENSVIDSALIALVSHTSRDIDTEEPEYTPQVSTFRRVVAAFGWVNRFIRNCKSSANKQKSERLSCVERIDAEKSVFLYVQNSSFRGPCDETLKTLNAFLAEDGLIRIKTKIIQRDDTYAFRYPMALPSQDPCVRLLIRDKHEALCHAGTQTVLSNLREEFWILKGRKTIKSVIKKCVACQRQDTEPLKSVPAPLPFDRVRDASVFEVSGVDFAGPLYLRDQRKAWICIFTCAVYRAVHLELVTSLSTERFIEAFRRFISRRGRPSIMYSDNGTNFEGFSNLLKSIDWNDISRFSAVNKIEWRFNPPSAPWWGGWWERLIQVIKRLLRRVLGRACLTYEEMMTVLCDCEAIVNSRPLTHMYEDPRDLSPITPAMFLQEIREVGVPDCDEIDRKKLKKRFLYRQKIKDELRCRFRSEYLGELKHRVANRPEVRKINVGDVVLIGKENTKRVEWPLARVVEIFAGKDGQVRVVRLCTATGELTRPIQRLYPLESESGPVRDELRTSRALNEKVDEACNRMNESVNVIKDKVKPVYNIKKSDTPYVTRSGRTVKKVDRF